MDIDPGILGIIGLLSSFLFVFLLYSLMVYIRNDLDPGQHLHNFYDEQVNGRGLKKRKHKRNNR